MTPHEACDKIGELVDRVNELEAELARARKIITDYDIDYDTVVVKKQKCMYELAQDRVKELEAAIRQHRDERGDDRCHADDGRLYAILPEGDTRPARETLVTLENCANYILCRQTGREYISPQRRIEELERSIEEYQTALTRERNRMWTIIEQTFTATSLLSNETAESRERLRTILLGLLYPDMNLRQQF